MLQGLGISWQLREECNEVCFTGIVVGGNFVGALSYLWDLEE